MSATLSGAVKAVVEAAGLSVSAYREQAPEGASLPFVVVHEGIASVPEPSGDFGDRSADLEAREQVQVDLYQAAVIGGQRSERYDLPNGLQRALHGAVLPDVLGGRCYPARVQSRRRIPTGDNTIRDTFTIEVVRVLKMGA